MSGVGSSPALATCETSQVLLVGVSGGFPGVLPFRPTYRLIMPPTLKKLMGHIAFGASVSGCVGALVTLFVPTVTFKPLKLES